VAGPALARATTVRLGGAFIAGTVLLVAAGCVLWVTGSVGVAQLFLVLASGTAGAGVALLVEHWEDR
jgi:hypothetical protein